MGRNIQIYQALLVKVTRDRWDAFPMSGDTFSERDLMLLREIKAAGGIDRTVPPGYYSFNIIPFNGKDSVTLLPVSN
jgi:hypothetical protein